MGLETLSGVVSQVHHSSETSGKISGSGGRTSGSIHTTQVLTFRVNNKPAQIKLASAASITESDEVSLKGKTKNGTFIAKAMKNNTTGAIDSLPAWQHYLGGGVLILFGLPLSTLIIGIPVLIAGIYYCYQGFITNKAVSELA